MLDPPGFLLFLCCFLPTEQMVHSLLIGYKRSTPIVPLFNG